MNRKITLFLIGLSIYTGLVFFNYFQAQKKLRDTRPAPLGISLDTYPKEIPQGQSGSFSSSIEASPDLSTPLTTILYGYSASPSALLSTDTPEAVGYPYRVEDYLRGSFKLPDTFTENIRFDKPGTVYFRAYAKVGSDHLWTDEYSIKITNP